MTCPSCRERLLEYVYGLLEDADPQTPGAATELRAHLESCPSCQEAYRETLQQQKLLARASRMTTDVRFASPRAEPARKSELHVHRTIAWYATAAAIFLGLLLAGGGGYWWGWETKWAPVEVALQEVEQLSQDPVPDNRPKLRHSVEETQDRLAQLRGQRDRTEKKAVEDALANARTLQVVAPPAVEAGKPANVLVRQQSIAGNPEPLEKLRIDVMDSAQRVLKQHEMVNAQASNELNFNVPPAEQKESSYSYVIKSDTAGTLSVPTVHPLEALQAEYVAHLCTDKPLYQPGEPVFFRALALEKGSLAAAREELPVRFSLTDPLGRQIMKLEGKAQVQESTEGELLKDAEGHVIQSVAASAFALPVDAPSGEYTLRVQSSRFAAQHLKLLVNQPSQPRFDKQGLHLGKLAYAPGEQVEVMGPIRVGATGDLWKNGKVHASLLVDGAYYDAQGKPTLNAYPVAASTDASGNLHLRIRLPQKISQGQATLALKLEDRSGAGPEIWTQTIPIELSRAGVEVFPEGGDLIAGVTNRVYFRVRNSRGEAMDGEGAVLDQRGEVAATFKTFHDASAAGSSRGMGRFEFIPRLHEKYRVKLTQPPVEQTEAVFPAVRDGGVVLKIDRSVVSDEAPFSVQITNVGPPRDLIIAAYCRGQLLGLSWWPAQAGQSQSVAVPIESPLGGVYRITVFEAITGRQGAEPRPLAERLVYRAPRQSLGLELYGLAAGKDRMQLKLQAKNEAGRPTAAYATIMAVNQSLLSVADDRTVRSLPAHFLLAQEVRDPEELERADFFLSGHPSSGEALDLLLGVQGWRRFKELDQYADVKRSWNERKPVVFDNRSEVQAAAEHSARVRFQQENAPLLTTVQRTEVELREAEAKLAAEEASVKEAARERSELLNRAREKYQSNQSAWETFRHWFGLVCTGTLGVLGIVGLVTLAAGRRRLHGPAMRTLAVTSILLLAGSGLCGYTLLSGIGSKPEAGAKHIEALGIPGPATDPAPIIANEARDQSPKGSPERMGRGFVGGQEPSKAAAQEESKAPRMAPRMAENEPAPRPLAMPDARKAAQAGIDAKPEAPKFPSPARPADSMRGGEGAAKGTLEDKTLKKEPGGVGHKETGPTGSTAKNETEQGGAYRKEQNRQRMFQEQSQQSLSGARSGPLRDSRGDAGAKGAPGGAGVAQESRVEKDVSGLGGGAGGRPAPGANKAQSSGQGGQIGYFFREYSWSAPSPVGQAERTVPLWSRTLYWNALAVVGSQGWSTMLEMPEEPGVWRITALGFDGQGRLGSAVVDVKTPLVVKPVSIQTRLSREFAKVGDVVQLSGTVQNGTNHRQSGVVVKIPLSSGLALPENLEALQRLKRGDPQEAVRLEGWVIDKQDLVLQWSEAPAGKDFSFTIDLICREPGTYRVGPVTAGLTNLEKQADSAAAHKIVIGK